VESKPPDPTTLDAAVLVTYGATMLAVQAFERSLAALVLVLEARPWKTRTFKSDEHFRSYLRKAIPRAIDVFQRASAKALRNKLPADFDPELKEEIERLIMWRDRLAHRYLVENARPGSPHFQPELFVELWQICKPFQEMSVKLNALMVARLS